MRNDRVQVAVNDTAQPAPALAARRCNPAHER
jgi:hypothetical protein